MDDDRDEEVPATSVTADERGTSGATRSRPERPSARRYELSTKLGEGGMGEVLIARDDNIGRDVAIKRMKQRDPSDRAVARFLREARIQGRLEHPSIVPVHEIGRDANGLPFFSMKRVSGVTLEQVLGDPEHYPRQRLLRAFVDVCHAVEFAHTRGVVHRDLKPANIMFGDFGEVYVLDWGVAKILGDDPELEPFDGNSDDGLATRAGAVIGTPGYMPLEQFMGQTVVPAMDVYALGCVLFEILAGQALDDRQYAADRSPANRAPERDIPIELDTLCRDATSTDVERRPTARQLAESIQAFLDGDRDLELRRSLARAQLDAAKQALVADPTTEHYRQAISGAGRALALDPTSEEAVKLMARLMIQPPPAAPPEVEEAIRHDDDQQFRTFGRISIISAIAYLPFIPMWVAVIPPLNVLVLVALLASNVVIAWINSRGRDLPGVLVGLARAGLIAALAWSFSPLFLAPALAATFAMALALDPRNSDVKRASTIVIVLSLAVLLPWFAELFGWLPSTATVTSEGVLFHADGMGNMSLWYLAAYHVALLCASVGIAFGLAKSLRVARRQLQLQAWQLRQLVPVA